MTLRMRVVAVIAACLGAAGAVRGVVNASGAQDNDPASPAASAPYRATLDQYCVGCHNARTKSGGVVLDAIDLANVPHDAAVWEKVVRKLNTRTMPPQGVRRPDEASYHAFASWLEGRIDRAAAASPNPGRPLLHRLNRAEYANAIRDLLALDVDAAVLLPPDDSAYGFDNISDVLGVSPSLQERYLSAAEKISEAAMGDPAAGRITETYRVRQDLSQDQHIEGLPLGTLGGALVRHTFPMDGEYDVQLRFFRTNFGNLRGLEHPHTVEVTLDGARIRYATLGGDDDLRAAFDKPTETADAIDARFAIRVPVKAGPHTIGVSFVENLGLVDTTRLQPFLRSSADTLDWTGRPHLDRVTVTGPFNATGPGRHAGAPEDLRLPAHGGHRKQLREADCRDARAPRVPAAGQGCRPAADSRFLQDGPARRHVRTRHRERAAADPREPEVRVPRRAGSCERSARAASTASATSSWRRGCRSSSGAAFRTTSC